MNREGVSIDLRTGLVPVAQQSDPTKAKDPAPDAQPPQQADPLEWAWVIIANASEGNWNQESKPWQEKAREWADTYTSDWSFLDDRELTVAMGRALALITRVNPKQSGDWRAAAAVWCRRHDTDTHRMHMYPFSVVPLYGDWAGRDLIMPPAKPIEGFM